MLFRRLLAVSLLIPCITTPSTALADVVAAIPRQTLADYMTLSVADNSKVLAPAKAAFDSGNINEARRLLEEAAAQSGIMPHPSVQLAGWLLKVGRMGDAIRVMEDVALVDPDRPDVRYMFAEIARNQGRLFDAWTHANAGQKSPPPERWRRDYAQHMQKLLAFSKAQIADRRGDWKTSEKLFTDLRRQGIRTYEVDAALGRAAFYQDRPDEAEAHFRRACQPKEVKVIPELLLAALYEQKGEPEKTEEWFKKGESAGKTDAERIRMEYAQWLMRQNRPDDARKVATKYRPSDENRPDFEYIVATANRMEGKYDAAEKILSRLHQSNAKSFAISNQLALVLIESTDEGRRGRAMQLATANVRKASNSVDAVSTYGWLQHRLGDSAAAEQTFNVILRGGQASRDVAYYVAQVKYALGQDEPADLLVEAAKTSDGQFFNAYRVDRKL